MFAARRISALRPSTPVSRQPLALRSSRLAYRRFLASLAVLEQRDGKLDPASLAAVGAAQRLGDSVTAFVAGGGAKAVAEEASKVKGLSKVVFVESEAYTKVLPCIRALWLPRAHTSLPGSARELCSSTRGNCPQGRLHPRLVRPLGLWQNAHAPPVRPAGFATNLRHH